jgi:methionine synthase I (cobalamin-dependent)
MQDLPQNIPNQTPPEVVEGELVYEDTKNNTLRNLLIAAGVLLILGCCCCASAGIIFSALGSVQF